MRKIISWYKTAQDANIPSAEKWIISTAKRIMELTDAYGDANTNNDYPKVLKVMNQMHSLANVLKVYTYKLRDGNIKSTGCDKEIIQHSINFVNSLDASDIHHINNKLLGLVANLSTCL